MDVSNSGNVVTSHMGGEVLVTMDQGSTWTVFNRSKKYSVLGSDLSTETSTGSMSVEKGYDSGKYPYESGFLDSVAAVMWLNNKKVIAGDFFDGWEINIEDFSATRRSHGLEAATLLDVTASPDGKSAIYAKYDASLVIRADDSSSVVTALSKGTGGKPDVSMGECGTSLNPIDSVVWPSAGEVFFQGCLTDGSNIMRICSYDGATYTKQDVTGLPSLPSIRALGYDETDSNILFFAGDCELYRGARSDASSTTWNWTKVYSPETGSEYACKAMSGGGSLSNIHGHPFVRVFSLSSTKMGIAAIGDRVVISYDGGLTWKDWNLGIFGLASEDQPVGYSSSYSLRKLTAANIYLGDGFADVYVGTNATCNSQNKATDQILCSVDSYAGGLYRRRLYADATKNAATSFTNLIRYEEGGGNICLAGGSCGSYMVHVTGIRPIDKNRAVFVSDVWGKDIVTKGLPVHVGGAFVTGDSGTTWMEVAHPSQNRGFSGIDGGSEGTTFFLGGITGPTMLKLEWTEKD